jgi:hypothetical protein
MPTHIHALLTVEPPMRVKEDHTMSDTFNETGFTEQEEAAMLAESGGLGGAGVRADSGRWPGVLSWITRLDVTKRLSTALFFFTRFSQQLRYCTDQTLPICMAPLTPSVTGPCVEMRPPISRWSQPVHGVFEAPCEGRLSGARSP